MRSIKKRSMIRSHTKIQLIEEKNLLSFALWLARGAYLRPVEAEVTPKTKRDRFPRPPKPPLHLRPRLVLPI